VRDVAEEPEVQRAVDDACDRWPRAGEAWDALTWVLARDAEIGTSLNEDGNRRVITLEGARSIDLPTLNAVYRVELRRILVERVRFSDAKAHQAGRG